MRPTLGWWRSGTHSSPSMRSCSRWGLPSRPRHRDRWCALTAPFHPCPQHALPRARWRSALCCTFRGLTPPGGYPAPCPVEFGLSSTDGLGRPLARRLRHIDRDHLGDSELPSSVRSSVWFTSSSARAFSSLLTATNRTESSLAAAFAASACSGFKPACLTRYSPVI